MLDHVNKKKSAMYRKASKRVLKELNKVFESQRKEMTDSAHTIVTGLQKDFEMILSNSEMLEASEVAREHMRGVLEEVDARFLTILGGEPTEVDTTQPLKSEPQQLPDVSMADVGATPGENLGEAADGNPGEAADAGPMGESGATETTP